MLERCIKYYEEDVFLKNKIIILDSSKKKFKYNFKKNFLYLNAKNKSFNSKILFGIKKSKTKYVILSNDDDFISSYGLNKGINFLNKNKKYSSIQGEFIFFRNLDFLNITTFVEAYFDTLKYNLNFRQNFSIDRVKNIYLKRPHWYNALHHKKNLEISYSIANKGNDLHFSELIIPLVIGFKGYVKTGNFFWYAKDSNVYKNLAIVEQKKRKNMLNEILSNNSPIKKEINKFILKSSGKNIKNLSKFNYIIKVFFSRYLLDAKHNSKLSIIKKFKNLLHLFLPILIKNLLRVVINYIKNNSFENSSYKKKYGPTNNNMSIRDWQLIKKHIKDFDEKYNYKHIYKNLK